MDFTRPLLVVTTSVDGDVLMQLALADAWFTTGRLHRTIGRHSEDGIRRALRRLVEQGIVLDQSGGNAVLYRLNRSHLASEPVVALANLWGAFVHRLSDDLRSWNVTPKVAALFGSAARGTMTSRSDIDLFLVSPDAASGDARWDDDVRRLAAQASGWTGNDVRILQLSEAHVRAHAGDEPVLSDVVADGVALAGDLNWLRRLVRQAEPDRFSS
jgi:predicted nucleotidyltransferase